jgi:hypothetical protein
MLVKIDYQYSQNGHKKKSHDYYIYNFLRKKSSKAAGLSQRLWLFATLSQAKALAGPAPLAWLGLAQTGTAWPGFRLKAGLGTSLGKIMIALQGLLKLDGQLLPSSP